MAKRKHVRTQGFLSIEAYRRYYRKLKKRVHGKRKK